MQLYPHQIVGAQFLASREVGALWDACRTGKTPATIRAFDLADIDTAIVLTTASGRAVWKHLLRTWSGKERHIQVLLTESDRILPRTQIVVASWAQATSPSIRLQLLSRRWGVLVADESHYGKSASAARTQAVYGIFLDDGASLRSHAAIQTVADRVWTLTATPMASGPHDLWPWLRALVPGRLSPYLRLSAFMKRYSLVHWKRVGFDYVPVVIKPLHTAELRDRIKGLYLRRTLKDIGLAEPSYDVFPLSVPAAVVRDLEHDLDAKKILAAAEAGDTAALEMSMARKRSITGAIKARALVEAIPDLFDGDVGKLVIMFWHRETGDILERGLKPFKPVRIDGSTSPAEREAAQLAFVSHAKTRIFLAQIAAAGESIDLATAGELIFCETSFSPVHMHQAAMRIAGPKQKRLARVRVAVLEGSIDAAMEAVLLRKWSTIQEVLQ